MPLLTSPIDGSPMRQIRRYGIEIDVCPTSGGIWLDKGELEKILFMIREEVEGSRPPAAPMQQPLQKQYDSDSKYGRNDSDSRHYQQKGYYGSGKHYKKDSKLSKIMDMFDF